MTNLSGVARYLAAHRNDWRGTVMLVGQPAEETGTGAASMLQDGLFERFPRPDFALALHIAHDLEVGHVAWWSGSATANVDTVDITLFGQGGHGSRPHTTIDPIVQAAQLVLSLQTIISREIPSADSAVLTIGSIHGGRQHNIIDERCHLQLTVRSYCDTVRQQLRDGIQRRSRAVALGAGAPEPDVQFAEGTPAVQVDEQLASRVASTLERVLGPARVTRAPALMVGEDYGRYGQAGVPLVMYRLGTVNEQRMHRSLSDGTPLPSLHSPRYSPDIKDTLMTGVVTMAASALELLNTPTAT
jgi:hippurate hydrolase